MEIRTARTDDTTALAAFARETYTQAFGHTFSATDLVAHLDKHLTPETFAHYLAEDIVLLAEENGALIGYIQFGAIHDLAFSQDIDAQELRRLYVHPTFQNQGVGTQLMEAALAHPRLREAPQIYLDVWDRNHGALRFYQRHGFEVIGTRAFEVESGAETTPDLIMVRRLMTRG